MSATGSCPGCGSPLTFRAATTLTTVCPHCRSIVVRGGAKLEAVGKTNEVLVSGSALQIGREGRYLGAIFTVVGRVQLKHDRGGVWDEWLVRFSNEKLSWLAEHQGRYAMLGEANVNNAPRLVAPAEAKPGMIFVTPVGELIVVEQGIATIVSQEGELPSRVVPGARRPFVDFTGRTGRWATLDFGAMRADGTREPKRFFVGRELPAEQLGLPRAEHVEPILPQVEGAKTARCPKCGWPVSKRRKDTESLTCMHCHSILSAEDDETFALLSAQERLRFTPRIPLGKTATLDKSFFVNASNWAETPRPWPTRLGVTVVAHLVRSVEIDGARYNFDEYLLETAQEGFFWLIESDGAWLFARHLDPGLVHEQGNVTQLEGHAFTLEQVAVARVEQVTGELYWRVRLHDRSTLTDYRSRPRTISREATDTELLWSECLDIPTFAMQSVFGISRGSRKAGSDERLPKPEQGAVVALVLVFFFLPALILITQCEPGEARDENVRGGSSGSSSGFHFGK